MGHMSKGYARSIRRPIGVPGASWAVVDQRKRLWTVPELWKTQTARFPQARWTAQRTRRPQRPTGPLAFTNDGPRRKMTRPFTTGKAHATSEGGRYVISPPVSAATRNGRLSSVVQWPVLSCPRRARHARRWTSFKNVANDVLMFDRSGVSSPRRTRV